MRGQTAFLRRPYELSVRILQWKLHLLSSDWETDGLLVPVADPVDFFLGSLKARFGV
jgi:hypothetical protein